MVNISFILGISLNGFGICYFNLFLLVLIKQLIEKHKNLVYMPTLNFTCTNYFSVFFESGDVRADCFVLAHIFFRLFKVRDIK
jgi:hypothetical protein